MSTLFDDGLYLFQILLKYLERYQSYEVDMVFILKFQKGTPPLNVLVELRFLFSAHYLVMLYTCICTMFHKIFLTVLKLLFGHEFCSYENFRGDRVVRRCSVNVQCRAYNFDYSWARVYCACTRCGWGLFGHFHYHLSFLFSFSLSLGDGPI